MESDKQKLIKLYAAMAKLTAPECRCTCRVPYSCCSPEYCAQALEWAREQWGVTLVAVNGRSTRGEVLPLLGPNGCVAAPHLRPTCTVHTCDINSIGFKKGDPDWTQRYFDLREKIDELEWTEALWRVTQGIP